MLALSVKQPWASLIAVGQKTIEVRTWRTEYRGPLLICASAKPDSRRIALPFEVGPLGMCLCIVDLVDIREGTARDQRHALVNAVGKYCWVLRNPRLVEPIPIKGRLGLFTPAGGRRC